MPTPRRPGPPSCNHCGAPLKFIQMAASGKHLPVDPIPNSERGNVAARWTGERWAAGYVLRKGEEPKPGFKVFRPHHADCHPEKATLTRSQAAAAFLF